MGIDRSYRDGATARSRAGSASPERPRACSVSAEELFDRAASRPPDGCAQRSSGGTRAAIVDHVASRVRRGVEGDDADREITRNNNVRVGPMSVVDAQHDRLAGCGPFRRAVMPLRRPGGPRIGQPFALGMAGIASTNGWNGPPFPVAAPNSGCTVIVRHRAIAAGRVLPIPARPEISTTDGRPARAACQRS